MADKAKTNKTVKRRNSGGLITRDNVHLQPAAAQTFYQAWDKFCHWYQVAKFPKGTTPTKYSRHVSLWKTGNKAYPLIKTIIAAFEETEFGTIASQIEMDVNKYVPLRLQEGYVEPTEETEGDEETPETTEEQATA